MDLTEPPFNAQERDIDLMLLEEICCNPVFLSWISRKSGVSDASLHKARHSVYKDNGETDVLVYVDTPDGRCALMIEDKIGAEMQPRQAERYHERGVVLCSNGQANQYRTLLCAPRAYLHGVPASDWHATLSFEEIAQWFSEQKQTRTDWRRDTLLRAITRQRRAIIGGYGDIPSVADSYIGVFKRDYRTYVMEKYPEFNFSIQEGRDKELYFTGVNFPSYSRFKQSFQKSSVALIFENHWKEKALRALPDRIPNALWIKQHDKTLDLVCGTEPIDSSQPVEGQTDLIDSAMEAARGLSPFAMMVHQLI